MASATRTATLAFVGCGAVTGQEWTVGTNICSGDLVSNDHGDINLVDNITSSLNGSAAFACNLGTWTVDQSTATCAPVGVVSVSNSAILQEKI